MPTTPTNLLFLKSALTLQGAFSSTEDVIAWMREQQATALQRMQIRHCPVRSIPGWSYSEDEGRIRHSSGRFFSIDGIRVRTDWEGAQEWTQPIINQPEVGFLGIIAKELDGVLHFLLQAKVEPGNLDGAQLSPTLQATRSNYTQAHRGRAPLFLDHFRNCSSASILLDQLQSEQGARFLRKRNRNIIIKIDADVETPDNFIWLTLGQIKALMRTSNLVNMDTRTVISGIPFGEQSADALALTEFLAYGQTTEQIEQLALRSMLCADAATNTIEQIITFLTHLKSMYDLEVERVPLAELDAWLFDDMVLRHRDNKYFEVIGVDIEIAGREVLAWSQPMVHPAQQGICAFVAKSIGGLLHLAVQAKMECGNHDIVEFAPTVQCLTGNYRHTAPGALPFLDYVLSAPPERIIYDSMQSEEGGRFYHEQNRNLILLAGDEVPIELPPRYIWMTLHQLQQFIRFNNYLNIQARSLLAAFSFAPADTLLLQRRPPSQGGALPDNSHPAQL